ncbi:MAG: MMPL family transporter, partial [Acidobacteriota bacterium]
LGFFDAQETSTAELLGFVAAVVILLLAFGSVIAMGLPLVSAVATLALLAGAYLFRQPLSEMVGLADSSSSVTADARPPQASPAAEGPAPGEEAPERPASDPSTLKEPGASGDGVGQDTELASSDFGGAAAGADSDGTGEPTSEAPAPKPDVEPSAPAPAAAPTPAVDTALPPSRATPPASSPSPSAGATASGARASEVVDVTWQRQSSGTRVTVQFNGRIDTGRFRHDELAWASDRQRIVMSGLANFRLASVAVGTSELSRIRIGHHPGEELHFVFDLASPNVGVVELSPNGDRLDILLQSR